MTLKPVVPLLLIGVLVAAITILVVLLRDPGHAIVVPLQVRPATANADGNNPESARLREGLLELAQSQSSPDDDEDGLERALRSYLALPPASRNADTDATASGLAPDRIAYYLRHGDPASARSLCLHFRWSAIRINALAPVCRQTLSSGRQKQDAMIRTHHFALLIEGADSDVRRAAERYLDNPYDGERLADLAIRLARDGELQAAELLLAELLQIDRMAAARLEHQLAAPSGVTHQGHPFEFEN